AATKNPTALIIFPILSFVRTEGLTLHFITIQLPGRPISATRLTGGTELPNSREKIGNPLPIPTLLEFTTSNTPSPDKMAVGRRKPLGYLLTTIVQVVWETREVPISAPVLPCHFPSAALNAILGEQ